MPGSGEELTVMFSRIAPRYDLINRVISLGMDQCWRRALLRLLPPGQPRSILDLCCGTGALLALLAEEYPLAELTGLDFSPGMLGEAATRFARLERDPPLLVQGDQNSLPFADGAFEVATNAFGLRNSQDIRESLREMSRVVGPGGTVALLELVRPPEGWYGFLYSRYFGLVAPWLARRLGGDPSAYAYLPESVGRFLSAAELAAELRLACGEELKVRSILGSAIVLLTARKPG